MEPIQNVKLSFKCPKQLNELQPLNGDWYCDGCQKMVRDFRGMSEQQIIQIITNNVHQTCGIFEASRIEILPSQNKWLRWAGAGLLFLGLTACHNAVMGKLLKPVDTSLVKEPRNPIFMGKTVMSRPSFPGGTAAFNQFLRKNLKLKQGITGEILGEVTIDGDGKVVNVKIVKGLDWSFNQQIADVLRFSPKWANAYGTTTVLVHINLADISR